MKKERYVCNEVHIHREHPRAFCHDCYHGVPHYTVSDTFACTEWEECTPFVGSPLIKVKCIPWETK